MFSSLKRLIYTRLPTPVRIQGLPLYLQNAGRDLFAFFGGRTDSGIPPHRLNISGGGSFLGIGQHNLMLCRSFGSLQATDSVLDLGCGIGRTALAMTGFLEGSGRYTGLDIIKFAIQWCRTNIGNRHHNFAFVHADVRNETYNPGGKFEAEEFCFPFAGESFDFCLATSLFTHLLPGDAEQYVKEAARVLREDGHFISTWFLLDEETMQSMNAGKSQYVFPFMFESHAQLSRHAPEQAVAYRLTWLKALFGRAGFEIQGVYHGGWSGVADSIDSGQDVVVARRASIREFEAKKWHT